MKTGKFYCRVADLTVCLPESEALREYCSQYVIPPLDGEADITVLESRYRADLYPEGADERLIEYQESGRQFSYFLLDYEGMYLHASSVCLDGRAYLFSGPSGIGKSTHTNLWRECFPSAEIFNDDKPALRRGESGWIAYGTPWCGKNHINLPIGVPIAGICFLKQGKENRITRPSKLQALQLILTQTLHAFRTERRMDKTLSLIERLLEEIPVFELECTPTPAAAELSYQTMRNAYEDQK